MTTNRIEQELALLRTRYGHLEYQGDGQWVRLPGYQLPTGWSPEVLDVVFQIPVGFPGTPPYGIYVASGLTFGACVPNNYAEPAPSQPPFGGTWGILSWAPVEGGWHVTSDPSTGSNLLNWALGIAERFREGR